MQGKTNSIYTLRTTNFWHCQQCTSSTGEQVVNGDTFSYNKHVRDLPITQASIPIQHSADDDCVIQSDHWKQHTYMAKSLIATPKVHLLEWRLCECSIVHIVFDYCTALLVSSCFKVYAFTAMAG
ncbi:hypothetical protein O0I10_006627 [Lichtheimia ornata]|uniref:Uncharacterized protein n=1 Tax=Lichtheimia ornata TaxID=688661 RepID=A0AAD7XYE6_9FUNG|nr:uncharacterized protein O0I10_006627 [Lichtheimia ornata]KAJ8657563.1 hypothetical protein O0I10_006627 [Lichtheimia ornata]